MRQEKRSYGEEEVLSRWMSWLSGSRDSMTGACIHVEVTDTGAQVGTANRERYGNSLRRLVHV